MRFVISGLLFVSLTGAAAPAKTPKGTGLPFPSLSIPFEKLKPEAIVTLEGSQGAFTFGENAWVALPKAVTPVDLKSNKPGKSIEGVDRPCAGVASAFGALWVPNCQEGGVARIDPKSGKTNATVPLPVAETARGIAVNEDSVWVLSDRRSTLARIDPVEHKVVAESRLPAGCGALAFGAKSLWVACPNAVLRVDPHTNLVTERVDAKGGPSAIEATEDAIWAYTSVDGKLLRIDPKNNKIAETIDLRSPGLSGSLAVGDGSVWVSLEGLPLLRIDIESNKVMQVFHGGAGGSVYFGAGSLWLSNPAQKVITRFDPKRVKETLPE